MFMRLPDDSKADYDQAKTALKKMFEPEAKKTLYQTRLQTRVKQKGEGWAEFGEDLLRLADKACPELVDAAKEQFALNQYFTQLSNPQVAFAVKQTKPTTIDEAVRATLEMESYSKPMPSGITAVSEEGAVAISSVQGTSDLKMIMEKMERMETQLKEMQQRARAVVEDGRELDDQGRVTAGTVVE